MAKISTLKSYLVYFNVRRRENLGIFHENSPRSRRSEVVGARRNGRARGRHARRGEAVLSCAHYFQAPSAQAIHESSRKL